jgi:opacity protein-like surface antigen
MVSVRVAAFVAVTALFATAARAADMPQLPPVYAPPMEEASGWYLRGDIGMSNQKFKGLQHPLFDLAASQGTFEWLDEGGFSSAPFFGVGVGYQFNDWLRFDVTGEYRGKSDFAAVDRVFDNTGAFVQSNHYTGKKSEWLVLANAYVDLGTWWNITPFVGAGIGASRNTISHFADINPAQGGGGTATAGHKWNFAWAAHAGIAYKVNSNLTIELGYRYLNLGDAMTGDFRNVSPAFACQALPCQPMHFKNIESHDFKFGVRWMLEPPRRNDPYLIPPLMRRG